MSDIVVFRDLPGIRDLEQRLIMANENRLMADELAQLSTDLRRKSLELFGITQDDTWFNPVDEACRFSPDPEWESNFAFLEYEYEEERDFWLAFGLDMNADDGEVLAITEPFGRQMVCALRQLHPDATLTFRANELTPQQIDAAAEAWGRMLTSGLKR